MRFKFDKDKSAEIRRDPRRGIGFEEVFELWDLPHYVDLRHPAPEQWRAIGWVKEKLFTVVYEDRMDTEGDYAHLVTLWKATKEERDLYEKHI